MFLRDLLRGEPVAVRAAIAAVLNLAAAHGVLDTSLQTELEVAAVAVMNVVLLVSARNRVTPV